jgi:enoyl-CoA hydratase/carnithine racemase
MIETSRDGDVHIVTMNAEPNTVQPAFVAAMHDALDEIEAAGAGAIVLTGKDKIFNSGLDVPVVMSLKGDDAKNFGGNLMQLLERLLIGPIPTVAAINGHAFAAGAFLAMSCDFRFMRADRGWMCISEVDVGVPIGAPMMNSLRKKLPATVVAEAVLTGKRFAADDAIAAGFADGSAPESELLGVAIKHAAELAAKESGIMAKLKQTLWADVARGLMEAKA